MGSGNYVDSVLKEHCTHELLPKLKEISASENMSFCYFIYLEYNTEE
jgi:hypothetical protein